MRKNPYSPLIHEFAKQLRADARGYVFPETFNRIEIAQNSLTQKPEIAVSREGAGPAVEIKDDVERAQFILNVLETGVRAEAVLKKIAPSAVERLKRFKVLFDTDAERLEIAHADITQLTFTLTVAKPKFFCSPDKCDTLVDAALRRLMPNEVPAYFLSRLTRSSARTIRENAVHIRLERQGQARMPRELDPDAVPHPDVSAFTCFTAAGSTDVSPLVQRTFSYATIREIGQDLYAYIRGTVRRESKIMKAIAEGMRDLAQRVLEDDAYNGGDTAIVFLPIQGRVSRDELCVLVEAAGRPTVQALAKLAGKPNAEFVMLVHIAEPVLNESESADSLRDAFAEGLVELLDMTDMDFDMDAADVLDI